MSLSSVPALEHVRFEGTPTAHIHRRERHRDARRPHAAPASSGHVAALPARVFALAGLEGHAYRSSAVSRRITACLRALDAPGEVEALARLDEAPHLRVRALSALLIGVTAFFRDAAVFDAMRRTVVPDLATRPGTLRIWSAGCSSGQELYSVAMLLAEAGVLERACLLGSDCRPDAIAAAREGRIDAEGAAAIPHALRHRWCEPLPGGAWRVASRLRDSVTWKVADVVRETEPGSWDLVLWRNLAIYLRPEVHVSVAQRIASVLAANGYLVLGRAERLPPDLALGRVAPCTYRSAAP